VVAFGEPQKNHRLGELATMPYFVYRIAPPRRLEYVDVFESYRDARVAVRRCREQEPQETGNEYRLIFAGQQGEAEKLLSIPRDERVIGED
jgi:hypothetical protein